MPALDDVKRQDDLIRALLAHPDNFDSNPQFALGYMVSMLARAVKRLPPMEQQFFMDDVDWLIDRHEKAKQAQKVSR